MDASEWIALGAAVIALPAAIVAVGALFGARQAEQTARDHADAAQQQADAVHRSAVAIEQIVAQRKADADRDRWSIESDDAPDAYRLMNRGPAADDVRVEGLCVYGRVVEQNHVESGQAVPFLRVPEDNGVRDVVVYRTLTITWRDVDTADADTIHTVHRTLPGNR